MQTERVDALRQFVFGFAQRHALSSVQVQNGDLVQDFLQVTTEAPRIGKGTTRAS
ncbi:unnamed protein product, partial [Nesidiocoris tenuis]